MRSLHTRRATVRRPYLYFHLSTLQPPAKTLLSIFARPGVEKGAGARKLLLLPLEPRDNRISARVDRQEESTSRCAEYRITQRSHDAEADGHAESEEQQQNSTSQRSHPCLETRDECQT